MVYSLDRYKHLLIIAYGLLALISSIAIKQDVLLLFNAAIVGMFVSAFLIKKEMLLLLLAILIGIFHEGISVFINGTYIMIYFYGLMALSLLINKKGIMVNNAILIVVVSSFLLSLLPSLLNGTSIPLLVISTLKRFGYLIVFLFVLNMSSIHKKYQQYASLLIILALNINFLFAVRQYSKGALHQDDITGLLGDNTTGVFMYLFMFYLSILAGLHYQKKLSTLLFAALTLVPIIYSAIAEVKIGFVSIAVLLIVYFLFINRSGKSFLFLFCWTFIFIWSYAFFVSIYPSHDFLSEAFLEDYLVNQSYGDGNTLNRFGFKSTIDTLVFSNNPSEILFGKGLGSGNPSELNLLMGDVYRDFDYLKYSWFALPYLYIETGWVGTLSYLMIYLVPLVFAVREFRRESSGISVVLVLMGITNFVFLPYNAGIFTYGVTTIYWLFVAIMVRKQAGQQKVNTT